MTVQDLIAKLWEMPHGAEVWLEIKYCDGELHQTPLEFIDQEGNEVYLQGKPE
jgi:hypothetical protein